MTSTATFALATLLALGSSARAEVAWIDAGEKNGTHVWYRDLPDANAREIKAETTMAAPPDRVWAVVSDIEHYPEFMPYLAEIRRLADCEGGYYQYERVTPPIIDARDYTLKITITDDAAKGVRRRHWSLANDKGPAQRDGTVRVTVNEGEFEISSDGKGGTRFGYKLLTNPGGSVPMWIAKRASTGSVPDLMDAIRSRAADPKWKR